MAYSFREGLKVETAVVEEVMAWAANAPFCVQDCRMVSLAYPSLTKLAKSYGIGSRFVCGWDKHLIPATVAQKIGERIGCNVIGRYSTTKARTSVLRRQDASDVFERLTDMWTQDCRFASIGNAHIASSAMACGFGQRFKLGRYTKVLYPLAVIEIAEKELGYKIAGTFVSESVLVATPG